MDLEELIQGEKEPKPQKNKVPEISIDLTEPQLRNFISFLNEHVQDISKVKIIKFGNRLMLKEGNEKAFAYIRLEKE
jgi:hypothetical protein